MERTKTIIISDVHLGRRKKPAQGSHRYDWLNSKGAKAFEGFLSYLNRRQNLRKVVFLGDILDNWVCPADETPPTFEDIMEDKNNAGIKAKLQALRDNPDITVHYIPGNHDMGVTPGFIKKYFTGKSRQKNALVYRDGPLRAEHGHLHGMFNAPDPVNAPGHQLPLGYYITRIETSIKARAGAVPSENMLKYLFNGIDDLLEAVFTAQTLSESVLEAVSEEYHRMTGNPKNVRITMPAEYGGGVVTVADMKDRYSNLLSQWIKKHGRFRADDAIGADLHVLGPIARRFIRGKTRFVVFGHSHELRMRPIFGENIDLGESIDDLRGYYANGGCWCSGLDKLTFLETEMDENKGKYVVWRQAWRQDKATKQWSVHKSRWHKRSIYI